MNYPVPTSDGEVIALRRQPVNDELVAVAIAGVVNVARSQGKSIEEIKAEILADDRLLNMAQRQLLSQILNEAWEYLL
ncbi:MAG: hypothetical protein F6K25_07160 [Okeania sp. SIO2G4]|uniref:hypothetical protein n=1 Tax=unclassified Okeania TaxID=2634635 RepID=UPI0013BA86C7|nr:MULTISPECIES: hypothetical protein [unclassified Okeania]NEP05528.1 hypothetical protein [Okeania sp. SIO4D6]NEP72227.1 hypothetical protein [Okeania sp. SIO2G5]NEP92255.1 hypothetical protein [Okeania sp. SIO2F5]NEQ90507.1 hypothetical protein [Okeania sp. SIO2G4]